MGSGDMAVQARQIYRNLGAVLGEAGGSLSDIVRVTSCLTYSGTYRTVRNEFFADPMPPNTLIICESLATPEFLTEVEVIAVPG